MIGTTLADLRERIEALATDDGTYRLVCGRYGDRPVPARGLRFESRATARAAATATEQYRAALRRYDPELPWYDVIVCQDVDQARTRPSDTAAQDVPASPATEERRLVDFCHRTAAVVFESLSEGGYDTVQSAVMGRYFELAEQVADPDTLCLRLLESLAREMATALSPAEQRDVLTRAARRYGPTRTAGLPVPTTLRRLQDRGLLEDYECASVGLDVEGETRTVVAELSGYALEAREGRLPLLPIVLELCRWCPAQSPSAPRVEAAGDGWRVTIDVTRAPEQCDLTAVPVP